RDQGSRAKRPFGRPCGCCRCGWGLRATDHRAGIGPKTGNLLWRYKRPFPEDMTPLHPTNRGVALYGDKVLFAAAEAILVALDAKTGKEVWTATVDDHKKGYYMSLAPLVAHRKRLRGASGGELGVPGLR